MWIWRLYICREGILLATRVGVTIWWGTFGSFLEHFHLEVATNPKNPRFTEDLDDAEEAADR